MSAIHNDKRTLMHVNTRNNGAIAGLPDDCSVEVTSVITKGGPLPLNVAPFEADLQALLVLMKTFERYTIEAAMTGDYQTAMRALVLNPLVRTGTVLAEALDETIRANIDFLPQFRDYHARNLA